MVAESHGEGVPRMEVVTLQKCLLSRAQGPERKAFLYGKR